MNGTTLIVIYKVDAGRGDSQRFDNVENWELCGDHLPQHLEVQHTLLGVRYRTVINWDIIDSFSATRPEKTNER